MNSAVVLLRHYSKGEKHCRSLWLFIIASFVGAALSAVVWIYPGDKEEKK